MKPDESVQYDDFSLVAGGTFYGFLRRARLLRPPMGLLSRRIAVIVAILWMPMLILTILEGHAWSGVAVPFLADVETYVRFFAALPLMIFAESVVHGRLHGVVSQFLERGIVTPELRPGFDAAAGAALRLRDSRIAEGLMLLAALTVGPWLWYHGMAMEGATWYARVQGSSVSLTLAGLFFIHAAAPVVQFLLLRWLFRFGIWGWFLWRLSRLPLALMPSHPDRAGGLGFLGGSAFAFAPVLLSQGCIVSGVIASRVLHGGQSLLAYRTEAALLLGLAVVLVFAPLCSFTGMLANTRRQGMREYGALAATYVRAFERKWLHGGAPPDEPLVGSADVQSLADMAGSVDVIREMSLIPFTWRNVLQLLATAAAPLAPLVLTVIPAQELLDRLLRMLL